MEINIVLIEDKEGAIEHFNDYYEANRAEFEHELILQRNLSKQVLQTSGKDMTYQLEELKKFQGNLILILDLQLLNFQTYKSEFIPVYEKYKEFHRFERFLYLVHEHLLDGFWLAIEAIKNKNISPLVITIASSQGGEKDVYKGFLEFVVQKHRKGLNDVTVIHTSGASSQYRDNIPSIIKNSYNTFIDKHFVPSVKIFDLDYNNWQIIRNALCNEKKELEAIHPHHAFKPGEHQNKIWQLMNDEAKSIFEDAGYKAEDVGGKIEKFETPPVWVLLDDGSKINHFQDEGEKKAFDCLSELCIAFMAELKDEHLKKLIPDLHRNLRRRYLWFNFMKLLKELQKLEFANFSSEGNGLYFSDIKLTEIYSEDKDDVLGLYVKLYQDGPPDQKEFNKNFPFSDEHSFDTYMKKKEGKYCMAAFVKEIFDLGTVWFSYFGLETRGWNDVFKCKLFKKNFGNSAKPFEAVDKIFSNTISNLSFSTQYFDLPEFAFFIPGKQHVNNYYVRELSPLTLIVGESERLIRDIPQIERRIEKYLTRTDLAGFFRGERGNL